MSWKSPLHALFLTQNAHFSESEGIELVQHFGHSEQEVQALEKDWALLDESHFGRLQVTGEDASQFLHNLTTNSVKILADGQGQSTVVTNVKGRILDWSRLLRVVDDFWLLTQPSTREAVLKHLEFYHFTEELEVQDVSDGTALLAVLGPESARQLAELLGWDPLDLPLHHHREGDLAGKACRLIRSDRFGHPGFRIWCSREDASEVAQRILAAGAQPVGEQALEQARIAAGEPGFLAELGEERNPLEAGLHDEVSFDKGCYLGQEVLARLDTYSKVQRFLVQLELGPEATELEVGTRPKLFEAGKSEKPVGWLSSWSPKPDGNGFWALGYTHKRCQGIELQTQNGLAVHVAATLTTAQGEGA